MLFFKSCLFVVGFIAANLATPLPGAPANVQKANAELAVKQEEQFKNLTRSSPCTDGQNACIENDFAQCANGQFVTTGCGVRLVVLPLVNAPGTSVTCTTEEDRERRMNAAKNGGSN